MGRRPKKSLGNEHPVHPVCIWSRLLGREKENAGGGVCIEKRSGGRGVIAGRCGVASKANGGFGPDGRQFVFALDCNSAHIGNIVKIKGRVAGVLSNTEEVVGVQKDYILFFEPLKKAPSVC